jgi:hypothetical protein
MYVVQQGQPGVIIQSIGGTNTSIDNGICLRASSHDGPDLVCSNEGMLAAYQAAV